MKKYLIICFLACVLYFTGDYLYYYAGVLYLPELGEVSCLTRGDAEALYLNGEAEAFEMRGVNLGFGMPGHYASERAIPKETYLQWFQQIRDLGANTVRIYGMANPGFYEALYQFNIGNAEPLYLLQGVEVNDYLLNSTYSALDAKFEKSLTDACTDVVDAIHGRHKHRDDKRILDAHYQWDVSPWVFGLLIGTDWGNDLVVYTNDSFPQADQFAGEYLYTVNARNFEIFLASVADRTIAYETQKYGTQRAVGFVNGTDTGPLTFSENVRQATQSYGQVDVNSICSTQAFGGGLFAAYHVYPFYPEYMFLEYGAQQVPNSFHAYISRLTEHHTMPVVIAEFGVPSSRGVTAYEQNRALGRDQGGISEEKQGQSLVSMWQDIVSANCAGGIVSSWQDEWYRSTWNTTPAVDLDTCAYWSDYQTSEQSFGLLSFDPGKEVSVCYVDGDRHEWSEADLVAEQAGYRLSMKYDLKFVYFLVEKQGLDLNSHRVLIPIDTTQKSGSTTASNLGITMSEEADFVLELNGQDNSRMWVQSRYDSTTALYGNQMRRSYDQFSNAPAKATHAFSPVLMPLREVEYYFVSGRDANSDVVKVDFQDYLFNRSERFFSLIQTIETGKLTYGNANPASPAFNSLADFCAGDGFVEIKLPWQLLNFADPTTMHIHDDYYTCYGVEYLSIREIHIGVGGGEETIQMFRVPMTKLGRNPQYHERLKQSYYILQSHWKQREAS